jgi:hypothetical protein
MKEQPPAGSSSIEFDLLDPDLRFKLHIDFQKTFSFYCENALFDIFFLEKKL